MSSSIGKSTSSEHLAPAIGNRFKWNTRHWGSDFISSFFVPVTFIAHISQRNLFCSVMISSSENERTQSVREDSPDKWLDIGSETSLKGSTLVEVWWHRPHFNVNLKKPLKQSFMMEFSCARYSFSGLNSATLRSTGLTFLKSSWSASSSALKASSASCCASLNSP
jgi:hypothetical protein